MFLKKMFEKMTEMPIWLHLGLTAGAFVGFGQVKNKLDVLYAASQHPVDFATGQTGFDGALVKSYYAHMQAQGTLDVYVFTQQFDFLFMACLALFGALFGTLVARYAGQGTKRGTWGRRFGFIAAGLAIAGATMDAMENLVSFVMLAQPQTFANWLALPYSGFASVKFALITLAMAAVLVSLILGALSHLRRRQPVLA